MPKVSLTLTPSKATHRACFTKHGPHYGNLPEVKILRPPPQSFRYPNVISEQDYRNYIRIKFFNEGCKIMRWMHGQQKDMVILMEDLVHLEETLKKLESVYSQRIILLRDD